MTINSSISFADGGELLMAGQEPMTLSGTIYVNGKAVLDNAFGEVVLNGTLVAGAADSVMDVVGAEKDFVQISSGLQVPGENSLTVLRNGRAEQVALSGPLASASGTGTIRNPIQLGNESTLRPGSDGGIGTLTIASDLHLVAGARWDVSIANADGASGIDWDSLIVEGSLSNSATAERPVIVQIRSQDSSGNATALQGFDPNEPYRWQIASSSDLQIDLDTFRVDAADFRFQNPGTDDTFGFIADGGDLWLTYGSGNQAGDFNRNGILDAGDIDMLSLEILAVEPNTTFDLNQDGVVNETDRVTWVEEIARTFFGDANLDGEFNSSDFVSVFKSGQYEDEIAQNSGWATGDWNGNGDFESGDFVLAFQSNGYEAGPRLAAVPEPPIVSILVLLPIMFFVQCSTRQ